MTDADGEAIKPLPVVYCVCYYCGAFVQKDNSERDHFPLPKRSGGVNTVYACKRCHSMKDRFTLNSWPAEWVAAVMVDWHEMRPETRIFLAKALAVLSDVLGKAQEVDNDD